MSGSAYASVTDCYIVTLSVVSSLQRFSFWTLPSVYDRQTVHVPKCPQHIKMLGVCLSCICVSHVWRTTAGVGMPAGEPGDFLLTPRLQDGPRQLCDSMGFISSLETARTPTPSCPPASLHMVCTSNTQTV